MKDWPFFEKTFHKNFSHESIQPKFHPFLVVVCWVVGSMAVGFVRPISTDSN
jgi:hypothetical protein